MQISLSIKNALFLGASDGLSVEVFGSSLPDRSGPKDEDLFLPATAVVGSTQRAFETPGAAAIAFAEDYTQLGYADINQVMRTIPGVYVRAEDGYGLFPNLSLRGVDTNRNSKITVMEDGILAAPAAYSAPAAYYSPVTGRMSAIEVLKGSSQIGYGPHTTGGVVNYLSTPIPNERKAYLKSSYGTDSDIRLHGWVGGQETLSGGVFGYLVEGWRRSVDGFKTIIGSPGFGGSDETGFVQNDVNLKFSFEPNWETRHRFELNLGYTDLDADEGYLGLSNEDFARDPYQRYPASRFDNMTNSQERLVLRHEVALGVDSRLSTAAYYTTFERNWYKLQSVNGNNLSSALFNGTDDYFTLRGQRAGEFVVRANNRYYYQYGVQTRLDKIWETETVLHQLEAGLRVHSDRVRRFQRDDLFLQDGGGAIIGNEVGQPGGAGDRAQEATAIAFHVRDRMEIGKLAVIPGFRFETIDYSFEEFSRPESGSDRLNVFAPGIGIEYQANPEWMLFGGYYQGYSVPGPRAFVRSGIEEERSDGFEVGVRHQQEDWLRAELIGFLTLFRDLIAKENIGGVGLGDAENVGDAYSGGRRGSSGV
ncbi:MAG: TonB-dependent receptor family protein [Puniceicoccaceae bacterium]